MVKDRNFSFIDTSINNLFPLTTPYKFIGADIDHKISSLAIYSSIFANGMNASAFELYAYYNFMVLATVDLSQKPVCAPSSIKPERSLARLWKGIPTE